MHRVQRQLACILTFGVLCAASPLLAEGERYIHEASGTVIVLGEEKGMFLPNRDASATGAPLPLARTHLAAINNALSKYPHRFLGKTVSRVYVLASLSLGGEDILFTHENDVLYVRMGVDEEEMESLLHAAIASMLYETYSTEFLSRAWNAQNPSGFSYTGDDTLPPYAGAAPFAYTEAAHTRGFLTTSGEVSLALDVLSYAVAMFMGFDTFRQAITDYAAVSNKYALLQSFYQSLHPAFTDDYFNTFYTPLKETTPPFTGTNTVYEHETTGVIVRFNMPERDLPYWWHRTPCSVRTFPIEDEATYERFLALLDHALRKYPAHLVRKSLKEVRVYREILFFNLNYGGTYVTRYGQIYIAVKNMSDDYFERTFHHEYSSILKDTYGKHFHEAAWQAANPKGFSYWGDGTKALEEGRASTQFAPAMHEEGFLCQYAQSAIEEDFNMYAENLFKKDRGFWDVVDTYPRVRKKADIAIAFYNTLDAMFTEAYFRRISGE